MSLNQRQGEMRMRSLNKRGYSSGPGGIRCDCCRPAGCTKADARKLANRRFRREMAREIRLEVDECR